MGQASEKEIDNAEASAREFALLAELADLPDASYERVITAAEAVRKYKRRAAAAVGRADVITRDELAELGTNPQQLGTNPQHRFGYGRGGDE